MNIDYLKSELKKVLSEKRFNHSIKVLEVSLDLAEIYKVDKEKVAIAALLHDYCKEYPREELIETCRKYFPEETCAYLNAGQILHSFAGAHFVEKCLKISDSDILNAIKYHTTGREQMELIEKIVYLADAIEPTRSYAHVDEIRKLAKENIDLAILFEVNRKIEHLISTDSIIHHNTIELRNWLITEVLK